MLQWVVAEGTWKDHLDPTWPVPQGTAVPWWKLQGKALLPEEGKVQCELLW